MNFPYPFSLIKRTRFLEFLLAYRSVTYGIPVKVEAFDIESNLVASVPLEEIVTGENRKWGFQERLLVLWHFCGAPRLLCMIGSPKVTISQFIT